MDPLTDVTITWESASAMPDSRSTPSTLQESCRAKCEHFIERLNHWLVEGGGPKFSMQHPTVHHMMLLGHIKPPLEGKGYTVTVEGSTIHVSK